MYGLKFDINLKGDQAACRVRTQDVEVEVPTAVACTVGRQTAVPASVCNLGAGDLEETAVR